MDKGDEFTNSIVNSALECLEKEQEWSKELVDEVIQLYQSDDLCDLHSLYDAFKKAAISSGSEIND